MAHVAGANIRIKITQRADLTSEAMAIYNDTAHTSAYAHRLNVSEFPVSYRSLNRKCP
jgi:hypothetical protein